MTETRQDLVILKLSEAPLDTDKKIVGPSLQPLSRKVKADILFAGGLQGVWPELGVYVSESEARERALYDAAYGDALVSPSLKISPPILL